VILITYVYGVRSVPRAVTRIVLSPTLSAMDPDALALVSVATVGGTPFAYVIRGLPPAFIVAVIVVLDVPFGTLTAYERVAFTQPSVAALITKALNGLLVATSPIAVKSVLPGMITKISPAAPSRGAFPPAAPVCRRYISDTLAFSTPGRTLIAFSISSA
jgi:hypothetical protein